MTEVSIEDILDKTNALYQLVNRLNWDYLIRKLGPYYSEGPRGQKSTIKPNESFDKYRFEKTIRKKGFDSISFFENL